MNSCKRFSFLFLVILLFCSSTIPTLFAQGKLGRARAAVRQDKPKQSLPRSKPREERNEHPEHDHEDEQRGRGRGDGGRHRHRNNGRGVTIGSWAPPRRVSVVEEVHVVHHHPTPAVAPGSVVIVDSPPSPQVMSYPNAQSQGVRESCVGQPVIDLPWVARISALGGTDFADISHGSLGLLLQSPGWLGLDTSVTMLRESGMGVRDHLYLGDVNAVYEPVLGTDAFRLRVGIGVNWLGDRYSGDAGFNMTGGFDWQLSERWMMTGEVDLGTIGDTDLVHGQIGLGRQIGQSTALTVGYDYRDIGGTTIGSAFTGLRFRF